MVAVKTEQHFLCVLLSCTSLSPRQKYWVLHSITFMENLCRQQQRYAGLHVKWPMPHLNKRMLICSCPSLDI